MAFRYTSKRQQSRCAADVRHRPDAASPGDRRSRPAVAEILDRFPDQEMGAAHARREHVQVPPSMVAGRVRCLHAERVNASADRTSARQTEAALDQGWQADHAGRTAIAISRRYRLRAVWRCASGAGSTTIRCTRSKLIEPRERVRRFLADKERARLLEVCRGSVNTYLCLIVVLALSTGARKAEILMLRWPEDPQRDQWSRPGPSPDCHYPLPICCLQVTHKMQHNLWATQTFKED